MFTCSSGLSGGCATGGVITGCSESGGVVSAAGGFGPPGCARVSPGPGPWGGATGPAIAPPRPAPTAPPITSVTGGIAGAVTTTSGSLGAVITTSGNVGITSGNGTTGALTSQALAAGFQLACPESICACVAKSVPGVMYSRMA